MHYYFYCPHCNERLQYESDLTGQKVQCYQCDGKFYVKQVFQDPPVDAVPQAVPQQMHVDSQPRASSGDRSKPPGTSSGRKHSPKRKVAVPKKKSSAVPFLLVFLLIAAGGGFFGYQYFIDKKDAKSGKDGVKPGKEEVIGKRSSDFKNALSARKFPNVLLHSRIYLGDDIRSLDPAYAAAVADTGSWKSVYSREPYLYFGIGRFADITITDDEMSQLAKAVQKSKLRVTVECGGLRFVNAAAFDDRGGEKQARKETKKLMRFIDAGGVVHQVVADHAIMHHIAMNHRDKEFRCQRTEPLPEDKKHLKFTWDGLYSELMDYFLCVKAKIPDCEFGCVASPGYFTFYDEAGNVKFAPKGMPEWEFGDYIDGLLAAAKKKGVTISFLDVDSSYTGAWLEALKKNKKGISVERISMAVRTIQSRGLKAGLFFQPSVNWKFIKRNKPDAVEDDSVDTGVARLKEFISVLHEAGVKPDRLIIRRAKKVPYTHGPEAKKGTYFSMVKQVLDEYQHVYDQDQGVGIEE